MTSSRTFDQRLVAYQPLGARIGPIPDLGFTVSDTAAGPTLSANVSTAVYGALPTHLEVAVEWWHQTTQQWQEGRDSRFAVTQFDADDRDRTGVVTLTALGLEAFLLAAAQLNGVDPYTDTTGTSEAARTNTTTSVSGTTWTWSGHVLSVGDRVRINAKGAAKNINTGSVYYVINPTSNTFQLARGASSSTAINAGAASNVNMSRVVTRIVFTDTHQFKKSDSVSVLGGSGLGLTDGTQYFVVNPTAATIQLTDKPGGVPIELKAAGTNVSQVYRYLDGQRVFSGATPGVVMDAVFLEARARGWGVGTDGTQLLHGWTTGAGSDGVAWTKMADDPTTPGISIGFQPGTPGTQVLQALLDNEYAEWYSSGRTVHLVNYGTGNDHTADPAPMRIGTTASAVKVQTDLTGLRNAITVRGTGPILVTQAATGSPWGRLETYETAQGATSKTLANAQASTDLGANKNPRVGYTVTEAAQEAAWLPVKDYSRGDWIAVQLSGTGWTRLRCVGWTFTKDPGGIITVQVALENIKRTLLTKQTKAIVTTSAGLGSTSTPGSTLQEPDNRPAAYPLGVTVTSTGFFAKDGTARATATVAWLPVVTDTSGGDIQAVEYDVWLRAEGDFNGTNVGSTAGLSLDIAALPSGHFYEVSVRARSSSGAWGELSPELEFQTVFPLTVPNPPTAPTFSTDHGTVTVKWDGQLVDPTTGAGAPELGFAYVQVWRSTTSGGTYVPVGPNMGNAGAMVDSNVAVGSTYWYVLVAFNTIGVASAFSTAGSILVAGVDLGSLTADLQTTISDLQTQAGSAGKIVYSATAPAAALQTSTTLWFDTSAAGAAVPKQWNGTTWVAIQYGSGALGPGSVVASTIAAGAVNTAALAAGSVTTPKIGAGQVTADKIEANTITANEIAAGAIDTNRLAAGAITADKLDLGTVPLTGSPVDRVLQPLTDDAFWAPALATGTMFNGISQGAATGATSNSGYGPGITLNNGGFFFLMPQTGVPASGKLHISGLTAGGAGTFVVREFDSTYTGRDTSIGVPSVSGAPFTFRSDTVAYYLYAQAANGLGYERFLSAHIFEVIGAGGGGQAAELSPSGLRLFDSNGALAVDLTTSTQQYLNIYDTTGGDPISIASIDQTGDAQFAEVSAGGYDINGTGLVLTDPNDPLYLTTLNVSAPNGNPWTRQDVLDGDGSPIPVPLLDRLGRGPVYDVTWPTQNGNTVSTQYERIAQDQFTLEDGRSYQFVVQTAGLQTDNGSGVNCYLEFQLNLSPNSSITAGDTVNRAVVYNNSRGNFLLPPIVWTASSKQTTIDHVDRVLPAGVPIYWQLNYNMSATPSPALSIAEFGGSRGLTVIDLGSAYLTRPGNGADTLVDVHDYSTSGASSGSTSGGTTATTTTKTWAATWSRTWHDSGSTIVTGSGQYTNGSAMYQGLGVTPMGSKFGFAALGLSGKTITGMSLYLHNTYFGYSGASALLGTHGDSSAPSTYTGSRANSFNVGWSQGQGKWVSVPKSLWAGFAAGTYRGFSLGINGSASQYGYFAGASQSNPPKIKISYH